MEVIGQGRGEAAVACEDRTTPRTQHVNATATFWTLEFENRVLDAASVTLLMIQAGCRCGARGFILPFIGVASIICLLVRESSISCLLVRVTVTEGTHPTPSTIMTEIVPQKARSGNPHLADLGSPPESKRGAAGLASTAGSDMCCSHCSCNPQGCPRREESHVCTPGTA